MAGSGPAGGRSWERVVVAETRRSLRLRRVVAASAAVATLAQLVQPVVVPNAAIFLQSMVGTSAGRRRGGRDLRRLVASRVRQIPARRGAAWMVFFMVVLTGSAELPRPTTACRLRSDQGTVARHGQSNRRTP